MFVRWGVYETKFKFGKYRKMSNFSEGKQVRKNQSQEQTKLVEISVENVKTGSLPFVDSRILEKNN